jgi:hypothetical protein
MRNERDELLTTSIPVANLDAVAEPVVLPFYADGGGWQSEILLVNPTNTRLLGQVLFFPPLSDSGMTYDVPPASAISLRTEGLGSQARTGWVRIDPSEGTPNPSGSLILSNQVSGITLSLGSVVSTPASSLHHIEVATSGPLQGQPDSVHTWVAIANPGSTSASVRYEILAQDGGSTQRRGTLTIAAYASVILPLDQTFESPFEGILRIEGDAVTAVGLWRRITALGETVITPVPPLANTIVSELIH